MNTSDKRYVNNLRSHVLKALNSNAAESLYSVGLYKLYFTRGVRILKQGEQAPQYVRKRVRSDSVFVQPVKAAMCLLQSAVSGSCGDKWENRQHSYSTPR
jgi:hypothetical protein